MKKVLNRNTLSLIITAAVCCAGTWFLARQMWNRKALSLQESSDFDAEQRIETHKTYQDIIISHQCGHPISQPDIILSAARERLDKVTDIGDFAGFAIYPLPFFKLSLVFQKYGDPELYDEFLSSTNPVLRAMGLLCYARTNPNQYHLLVSRFETDVTEIAVYRQTCNPMGYTIGSFAAGLRDDPEFFWYDASVWDFPYFKARVELDQVTVNMLTSRAQQKN